MDKEKLKLIIRNLELLVDSLKSEVYSDIPSYNYDEIIPVDLEYGQIVDDGNLNDY